MIILRPLDESIAQLEHIAGGDLTHEIRGEGDTEMGRPVRAMQRMQQALASSVSKVRDASSQIDTGSRELAAGNLHRRSAPKNRPLRWKRLPPAWNS